MTITSKIFTLLILLAAFQFVRYAIMPTFFDKETNQSGQWGKYQKWTPTLFVISMTVYGGFMILCCILAALIIIN